MTPRIPLVDLTRQAKRLEPELRGALAGVVRSGSYILGSQVRQFEREFARACGVSHAVGVASGTDALELGLRALGVGPGDWVATVSFTFLGTVDAIHHVGAKPLFVDIASSSFTMNPRDLERKVRALNSSARRRIKAILPVHLYGNPCDMERIGRIARRLGVPVLEDAAQAAGARWRGRPVGGLSAAAAFSFFPTKNLGACGDGGAVVTRSGRLARRLRTLRVHGRAPDGRQVAIGRNSRLDELQAAILRVKLRHLRGWVAARRKLAAEYDRRLSGLRGIRCPGVEKGSGHAYHLYTIRTTRRAQLQQALGRSGVGFGLYYPTPVHRQPVWRRRLGRISLPETERAAREVLSLPLYPELSLSELRRVCSVIRAALGDGP